MSERRRRLSWVFGLRGGGPACAGTSATVWSPSLSDPNCVSRLRRVVDDERLAGFSREPGSEVAGEVGRLRLGEPVEVALGGEPVGDEQVRLRDGDARQRTGSLRRTDQRDAGCATTGQERSERGISDAAEESARLVDEEPREPIEVAVDPGAS